MPQLSIIVPIYNVESYLGQCLESIRTQTFQDWECLLFSDGSKDHSIDIMRNFANMDKRFKVIEKPNEGYGATCNRGLEMAQGEWIAIVEPDDFISPNMYERLLGATSSDSGTIDIAKGSYCLYFDGHDGYADALQTPNLSNMMPNRRTVFSLHEFAEPFYHHPSIWSAIYRKAFLDGDNRDSLKIRFKPIPGGGWADNPFFAQTMVLADRISWIPGKYYYYRQTNPGASSFVKDYHLPFDRLREMREFLDTQNLSREEIHAFYSREFDYVTSVIGEYGFGDKDEDVRALIREVFESMDRTEVYLMAERLRPEFLDYYMDFMGDSYDIHHHPGDNHPALSIVLFTKNARSWIINAFESYSRIQKPSVEFVIIDAGSKDSTVPVAQEFAAKDKRFVVETMGANASMTQLVDRALDVVRGDYVMFIPSHYTVSENFLRAALAGARRNQTDVALLDAGNTYCDYLVERLTRKGIAQDQFIDTPSNKRGPIYGPLTALDIPEIACAVDHDYAWKKVFRTEFLRDQSIHAGDFDIAENLIEFGARAMIAAKNIAFLDLKTDWDIRDIQRKQIPSSFWLALEKPIPYTSEPESNIDSVLELGNWLKANGLYQTFEQGYVNALLNSFVTGVSTRYSPEGIEEFLSRYLEQVEDLLCIKERGALYFFNTDAFNDFQKITLPDHSLALWLEERLLQNENLNFHYEGRIDSIHHSARYKLGEQIVSTVKKMSPSTTIAKAQEYARKLRRK